MAHYKNNVYYIMKLIIHAFICTSLGIMFYNHLNYCIYFFDYYYLDIRNVCKIKSNIFLNNLAKFDLITVQSYFTTVF